MNMNFQKMINELFYGSVKQQRPMSVTVIAWWNIVFGTVGVIMQLYFVVARSNYIIFDFLNIVRIVIGGLLGLFVVASGIAMLKGFIWGRSLYIAASLFSVLFSLATSNQKNWIVGIPVFLIITFFLFRPAATAYFTRKEQETGEPTVELPK